MGMVEVGKPSGLARHKNGVWYFRKRWPKRYLQDGEKRSDFKRSMRTSDYDEAISRVVTLQLEAERFFQTESSKAVQGGIVATSSRLPRPSDTKLAILQPIEAERLVRKFFSEAIRQIDANPISASEMSAQEAAEYRNELNEERGLLTGADNPRNEVPTGDLENRLLHENGYRCDWNSEAGKLLREHLRRAAIQLLDIRRARFDGDFSDRINDSLFVKKAIGQADGHGLEAVSLGKAIEEYRQVIIENGRQAGHQLKTTDRYVREIHHIEHFFGSNRALQSIRATECDHFRSTFARLPINFQIQIEKTGWSYEKLADHAKAEGLNTLQWNTQEKYLAQLERFLEWASKRDYVTRNYAKGSRPSGRKPQGSIAKLPFEDDELQRNFDRPIYTGCVDDAYGFNKPGPNIIRRSRYWLPLIGLFGGLRSGEILQLTPDHFKVSPSGVHFMVLTPDMKLKNGNAEREIPVHPFLERIGLIDWVRLTGTKGQTLFPEVHKDKFKSASSVFSKRFRSDLKNLNLGDRRKKLTFHSFRHTFKRALDRAKVPEHDMEELCGWSREGKTSRRYGTGLEADRLIEQIAKVEYDIRIEHLVPHRAQDK